jgi:methyl-accepting chemotaxis protein
VNPLRLVPLGARLAAAFAILAVALLAVGLVGVSASRSLDLSSTSSSQGKRSQALGLALALSAVMAFVITRSIARPIAVLRSRLHSVTTVCLARLGRGLEATARGDLTVAARPGTDRIGSRARDEIGAASAVVDELIDGARASIAAYETTRANLGSMIGQVSHSARGVSAASEQVATNSEETGRGMAEITRAVGSVAGGAERQVIMVTSASDTAARMESYVGETARTTEETAGAARDTREVARQGVTAAAQASAAMGSVRDASHEVTTAIRGLAGTEQTLRAVGVVEQGAQRTGESAATVEQARQAFEAIGDSVDDMNVRIEQIAAAAQEIAAGATRMRGDVSEIAPVAEESSATTQQVSASTEQTSASTQQIAASAQDLARTAEELERLVGRFTLA